MSFNALCKNLTDGNFEYLLQNSENQIKSIENGKQLGQILGHISHFIYNKGSISKDQMLSMKNVVLLSLTNISTIPDLNRIDVLKSLIYILVYGIRKGLGIQNALGLTEKLQQSLNQCEDFYLNHSDSLKRTHSTLWNLSLQKGVPAVDSLLLQSHALSFLCLVDEKLSEVISNCQKVGKLAESQCCPLLNIEALYQNIFTTITIHLKRKPSISDSTVMALNLLLIEYAKCLYSNRNFRNFSKQFKPLAFSLESLCDPKIILAFKMSVKVVEMGMALTMNQCTEDLLMKILHGCSVISKSSVAANTILVEGLLYTYQLIGDKGNSSKSPFTPALHSVFHCLMERISKESELTTECLLKVLETFGVHLNKFVNQVMKDSNSKKEIFGKSVVFSSSLKVLMSKARNCKGETHVYNIGINCCNLGVLAFKDNQYEVASEFLDTGVQYLNCNLNMCATSKKPDVLSIMRKKAALLKDSLRYSGKYKEAAKTTLSLVGQNILPKSDVILTWMKCRRDAHKDGCNSLKNICIKDVYQEIEEELAACSDEKLTIEELLMEELKELQQQSYDTREEEVLCATSLVNSDDFKYSIEGSLALVKVLWSYSELAEGERTPIKVVRDVLHRLEMRSKKKDCDDNLELKARAYFWLYLSNLQIIQEKAESEVEEKQKCEQPLTAQSTDLGEEVQPNDACSIRPSTSVTTFATQEETLKCLHHSLCCWERVVKGKKVVRPLKACTDLLSIGFIYKLSGVLSSCVEAFSLLVALADAHDIQHFWIHGLTELMEIVPELISVSLAERLLALLNSESEKSVKFTDYFKISSLSTLAYYFLRRGEFASGADLILNCLSNPLMEKRTPAATEVQISVYFVASQFAFLPSSALAEERRPKQPCLFLALSATRKTVGLINAFVDHNHHENICWRHKVAWLHHVTNLWLGRLCHFTAQPRLARAYLRQALTLAEKLALPLRTVELLCALAEIDLQCDQLDDCRVKIDSLDFLFKVHLSDTTPSSNDLPVHEELDHAKSLKLKRNADPHSIPIYSDVSNTSLMEGLRESNVSPEFSLKAPSRDLGGRLIVIGEEKRIKDLAAMPQGDTQCPSSPSFGFREERFVVRRLECPKGVARCPVCIAPELHAAALSAKVSMGVIHAHRNNMKGARQCFNQAQEDLDAILNSAKEIHSRLASVLSIISTEGKVESKRKGSLVDSSGFLQSQMALVHLSLMFHRNEVLCIEQHDYTEMESKITTTMTHVSDLPSVILNQNHPLVVQLILQGNAVLKSFQNQNSSEDIFIVEESSPLKSSIRKSDSSPIFKTPSRSTFRKNTRKLGPPSTLSKHPPSTPFRIFTDDETSSSSEKNLSEKSDEKEIRNLTSSFGRLVVEGSSPNKIASISGPQFSPLSSHNSSPFSQVLQLPDQKDSASADGRSNKLTKTRAMTTKKKPLTADTKLRKLISKTPCDSEAVKENSPLIKTRLNVPVRAKPSRKPKTGPSEAQPVVRETRSSRNLKRL